MDKTTVTFRLDADKKAALDSIASSVDRDRSYVLTEAVDHYLDLHSWQVKHIQDGLRESQTGRFAPDSEVDSFFRKTLRRKP